MTSLLPIIILATVVVAFGAGILFFVSLLGPKKVVTREKMMPYECGIPGQEPRDSTISVKFYLTAILFIIFDIEIVFMYPWAITFRDFIAKGDGLYALLAMGLFVLLFVVGLFWEVKSKALDWN
jgi:NADH-quinone oxidoreductase subunit A